MLEIYKLPKRRLGCSICGTDKMLVFSSILHGYLCKECYDKVMTTNGVISNSGEVITKEMEMRVLDYKNPYSKLLIKVLEDIYHRYPARVDKIISTGNKIKLRLKCTYRGKECNIDIKSGYYGNREQIQYKVYDANTKSTKVIRTFVFDGINNKTYILRH